MSKFNALLGVMTSNKGSRAGDTLPPISRAANGLNIHILINPSRSKELGIAKAASFKSF